MARISIFDYHEDASFLHQLDVRFKLILLLTLNLVIANTGRVGLALLSIVSCLILIRARISPQRLLFELRLFLLLLVLVWAARSFSEPGTPLWTEWPRGVTIEGLVAGGLVCWRLLLILLFGLFFMRTSSPWRIKSAIYWFLKFLPGVPAHRISLMISLMFRFIPMIIEVHSEISEAQQARLIGLRKNPLIRLKMMTVPLLENCFKRADEMVLAMEARCYNDKRTDPDQHARARDWIVLLVTVSACLFVLAG